MRYSSAITLAAASLATAQNTNQSICDKYTTAVFTDNNSTNQYLLLKYVVNTALIGNFTPAPTGSKVAVQGILNPNGTLSDGTAVNLVPYFNGGLASSPGNGMGQAVNWLDDGGAAPLMNLMPANGTSSKQYQLVSHLYSFFGALLGCSTYGSNGFPSYSGNPSMYAVHAFMDLDQNEMNYFIGQVGAAAESFGVTTDDATTVGNALNSLFNYRCLPAANVTSTDAELQSICIDPSCPIAAQNPNCAAYGEVLAPIVANSSLADGEGVSSTVTLLASGQTSATGTSTGTSSTGTGSSTTTTGTGSSTTTSGTNTGTTTAPSSTTPAGGMAAATGAPLAAVLAAGAFVLAL